MWFYVSRESKSCDTYIESLHEGSIYASTVCENTAIEKTNRYTQEVNIHENENDITSTQNMINDARERRKIKSKRIHCDECQMRFNKDQTFKAHMKKVHGGKPVNQLNLQESNNIHMTFQKNNRNLRSYKT